MKQRQMNNILQIPEHQLQNKKKLVSIVSNESVSIKRKISLSKECDNVQRCSSTPFDEYMGQKSGGARSGGKSGGGRSGGKSGGGGSIIDDTPIGLLSQKYSGGGAENHDNKHLEMFKKFTKMKQSERMSHKDMTSESSINVNNFGSLEQLRNQTEDHVSQLIDGTPKKPVRIELNLIDQSGERLESDNKLLVSNKELSSSIRDDPIDHDEDEESKNCLLDSKRRKPK